MAETILQLARVEHLRVNLLEYDLLHPTFYLANHDDETVSGPAAEALEELGIYSHTTLHAIARRKIEILRYLCSCVDVRAQRAAAGVLDSLLKEEDREMNEEDCRALLQLMSSLDEQIQQVVVLSVHPALEFLSANPAVLVAMVGEGIVSRVAEVVLAEQQPNTSSVAAESPELKLLAATVITQAIRTESEECGGCSTMPIVDRCWRLPDLQPEPQPETAEAPPYIRRPRASTVQHVRLYTPYILRNQFFNSNITYSNNYVHI